MKKSVIILTSFFCFVFVYSQKLTFNPFSKLGLGEIWNQANVRQLAMGGTSLADFYPFQISKTNPANSAALFRNRAIFELGAFGKLSNFNVKNSSQINFLSNISHIYGGFRVFKWYTTSFGLSPYSAMGYTILFDDTLTYNNYSQPINYAYDGLGGINQIFWANSFTLFKKISFGFNLNYNYGFYSFKSNVFVVDSLSESYTEFEQKFDFRRLTYNVGILFNDTLKHEKTPFLRYSIGAIYSNNNNFNAISVKYIWRTTYAYNRNFLDSLLYDTLNVTSFVIPKTFGLGISLTYKNSLTFNADYIVQKWSESNIWGQNGFNDYKFLGVGVEYCQDMYSPIYYKTIAYRVGYYKINSYLNFSNSKINTQALTFGVNLPFRAINFNFAVELGKTSTSDKLINEYFSRFSFGLTLIDIWFVKRLYN